MVPSYRCSPLYFFKGTSWLSICDSNIYLAFDEREVFKARCWPSIAHSLSLIPNLTNNNSRHIYLMVRTHHSSGRPSLLKALLMKLGVISQQQQSSLSPSLPRSSSTVTLHINLQSVSGENNNQVNNDLDNEDGFQYDGVVIHITNQTPEEALRHDNDEERIPTPARQNPRSRVLKISKPPGEPGRPGCGGYSLDSVLRNELSWSKEDVVRFMVRQ